MSRVSQGDVRNAIERYFREHAGCAATVKMLEVAFHYTRHQIDEALRGLNQDRRIIRRRVKRPTPGGRGARWQYEYARATKQGSKP